MEGSKLIITCKKPVKIVDPNNSERFEMIAKGYTGPVSGWILDNWYFKALCNDKTITVVYETSTKTLDNAAELAAKAEELIQEKAVKLKEATDDAIARAEIEAAEQGLDQVARKKLITKYTKEAKKAVEMEFTE